MARDPDAEASLAAAQDSYVERIAVAVLRAAFSEEGPSYAYTEGGRLWLAIAGLDPDTAYDMAGSGVLLGDWVDSMPDLSKPFEEALARL